MLIVPGTKSTIDTKSKRVLGAVLSGSVLTLTFKVVWMSQHSPQDMSTTVLYSTL